MRYAILSVCFFFALVTTGCGWLTSEKKKTAQEQAELLDLKISNDRKEREEKQVQLAFEQKMEKEKYGYTISEWQTKKIEMEKEKIQKEVELNDLRIKVIGNTARAEAILLDAQKESAALLANKDAYEKALKNQTALVKEREQFLKEREAMKAKLAIVDIIIEIIKLETDYNSIPPGRTSTEQRKVLDEQKRIVDEIFKLKKKINKEVMDLIK